MNTIKDNESFGAFNDNAWANGQVMNTFSERQLAYISLPLALSLSFRLVLNSKNATEKRMKEKS